jgi:DNA uptake protein ComE-like DNA-binding protein
MEHTGTMHQFPCENDKLMDPNVELFDGGVLDRSNIFKYACCTAPGSVVDSFSYRYTKDMNGSKELLLLCGKRKYYTTKDLTTKRIEKEAKKVHDTIQDKIPYILIIFSIGENPYEDDDDIPNNCLLICGKDLSSYYGNGLCAQARFIMEGEKININSASYQELLFLPGVGESTAKFIIKIRKSDAFKNWEDLSGRCKPLSKVCQNLIEYSISH